MARNCVTVELEPTLGRRVEIAASGSDTSVREWIEEAVRRKLEREAEAGDPFTHVSVPAFERDWGSEDDAVYDELDS